MPKAARAGFTLIELIVVVVIVGILATVTVSRFEKARERAYLAEMEGDLRILSIQEELYYGRQSGYTTVLSNMPFQQTPGVTLNVTTATSSGWAATAGHMSLVAAQCGIFMGTASPANAPPATVQGQIACTF